MAVWRASATGCTRALARTIAPGVTGERRAVVAGIVLGEDEGLSDELRDRFRASGLYHLLAVSGQNVAFLAGGVLALAWLARAYRGGSARSAFSPRSAATCSRSGGSRRSSAPASRAASPRSRGSPPRSAIAGIFLLVGAVVLLAWNPYSLLEPGFQLSFAAVAAIFVAVPRLERALEGYPVPASARGGRSPSRPPAALATAPILWLQFGAVPLYSVLANALAAPVVGAAARARPR